MFQPLSSTLPYSHRRSAMALSVAGSAWAAACDSLRRTRRIVDSITDMASVILLDRQSSCEYAMAAGPAISSLLPPCHVTRALHLGLWRHNTALNCSHERQGISREKRGVEDENSAIAVAAVCLILEPARKAAGRIRSGEAS